MEKRQKKTTTKKDKNGQKHTKTNRKVQNKQKRIEMDKNGQKRTETDGNRQKQLSQINQVYPSLDNFSQL